MTDHCPIRPSNSGKAKTVPTRHHDGPSFVDPQTSSLHADGETVSSPQPGCKITPFVNIRAMLVAAYYMIIC